MMETPTLPKMNSKVENTIENFLIQINKSKLGDYISKGLICPDKFLGDEVLKDTQSVNNNFLIISDGYINELDKTQLLLELILTESEKKDLKKVQDNNIFLLDKALPISRIKRVYCQSQKKDSKEIISSLLSYQNGYISEKLFKTFPKGKNRLNQYSLNTIVDMGYQEYKEEFLKYDKVMGMFSLIKNTNLYYVNNTNSYSNYSDKYFKFYDFETNEISIKTWISENFYITEVGKKFINRLHSEEYVNEDFINEIIKIIDDGDIKNSFKELLFDPLAKKDILKSLEKDNLYYFICLLYIYGKKGSNAKDILKDNILEEIPFEKAENALALLGLYYGYSSLKAYEEIEIENKYYKTIEKDGYFNIKFKLDSKLDYKIIESIYQYSFNNEDKRTTNDFSYLDEVSIKSQILKLPRDENFKRWYKVEKNKKNDIYNIKIEKQCFKKLVIEKINKYPQNIEAKYKIFSFVYENYNELIEFEINSKKETKKIYFEKDIFLKKIENETDMKIQNKLLENLEYDKK